MGDVVARALGVAALAIACATLTAAYERRSAPEL